MAYYRNNTNQGHEILDIPLSALLKSIMETISDNTVSIQQISYKHDLDEVREALKNKGYKEFSSIDELLGYIRNEISNNENSSNHISEDDESIDEKDEASSNCGLELNEEFLKEVSKKISKKTAKKTVESIEAIIDDRIKKIQKNQEAAMQAMYTDLTKYIHQEFMNLERNILHSINNTSTGHVTNQDEDTTTTESNIKDSFEQLYNYLMSSDDTTENTSDIDKDYESKTSETTDKKKHTKKRRSKKKDSKTDSQNPQ